MNSRIVSEFWKVVRFLIIGAIATGIYVIAAMMAVEFGGVTPVIGTIIAYFVSFLVSYVGHKRFTFGAPGRYSDYALKSAVTSGTSFLVSTIAMWVITRIIRIDYRLALVGVSIIIPICSYVMNRFWVFLDPSEIDASGRSSETI